MWDLLVKSKCSSRYTNYCDWIQSIASIEESPTLETLQKAAKECVSTAELPTAAEMPTTVELPVYVMIIIGLVVFLLILVAAIWLLCPHKCQRKREEPENLNANQLYL